MRGKLKGVYCNRKRLADGICKDYYSLRHVGAISPLPGDEAEPFFPMTPAFMRAYNKLIELPSPSQGKTTLQGVISRYQRSPNFQRLSPRTKLDYNGAIMRIEKKWGTCPLEAVEDPKIRRRFLEWRDLMAESSPRQADMVFGVLRIILEFGRDRGDLAFNHATRPKKVYRSDRSNKLWLDHHIKAFRAVAPPEMVLAMDLALYTGQRQGDLLRLTWSSYDGQRITFRQGKRKRKIDMPVTTRLKALLDAAWLRKRSITILETASGIPWTKSHFNNHWRPAILIAGLDGLHFHDIRGTTCTALAEAGATASEIAAMLGWTVSTVNNMLDTYQSMTAALSDSAVAKLELRA